MFSIMYRGSLARLVRSVSPYVIRRQHLIPYHLGRAYLFQSISCLRVPRHFSCDTASKDGIVSAKAVEANAAGSRHDTVLSEILSMEKALELLQVYSTYKDAGDIMIQVNRIAVLRRIAYIVQRDGAQRFALKPEIDKKNHEEMRVCFWTCSITFWSIFPNLVTVT